MAILIWKCRPKGSSPSLKLICSPSGWDWVPRTPAMVLCKNPPKDWMWKLVDEGIAREFRDQPGMGARIADQEAAVAAQKATPAAAARVLLDAFRAR